jgi:hypothetical protein
MTPSASTVTVASNGNAALDNPEVNELLNRVSDIATRKLA